MNLKNFLKTLLVLTMFTALVNTSAFAANWYVSNTNGNDVIGTGTALQPYRTIAKALAGAADGDFVYIDADTYNEANVSATVAVHFVARTFNALNTVTITNGMTINVASTKTVYLGAAADGSQKFNLGTGANALKLTAGNLNITGSNVTIGSGGTVTVTAGTLSEALTTTNVNVTYNGTADVTAGPELPSSLGTGTLTVGITATKTLTAGSAVSFTDAGNVVINTGNVTFNAGVTFNYANNPGAAVITNNGVANTVTFNGAINLNAPGATPPPPPSPIISFDNTNTGTLAFVGGIVNNVPANITLSLNNTNTGKVQLGASTINGTIANNAGGTIELVGAVTFSGATIGNGNAASVFKLNSNQLTLSNGAAALTNTGNIISSTASTVGTGMLNISGVVTLTGGGELPNVTLGGTLVVPTGTTVPVYGTFTHASSTVNALDFGAAGTGVLEIWGSGFNRTDNTPLNVRAGNGTLSFRGGLAQNFTPGASLNLYDLTLNKTASTTVTLTASVNVANNLTITSGQMNVGDFNLNLTGATSVFDNSGNAYSSTGNGYVVFSGATPTIQGTGVFGNILVSVGNGNTLSTGSSITMSGTLYLYSGALDVAAAGHTVTFSNDLVANPTIKVNTTAANGATFTNTGGGTITYSANVNLYYLGSASYTAGVEWTGAPTKLNDVTIATDGGTTVTSNNTSTIAGTLTVNGNTTLAQGAFVYTLSGDAKIHSIVGTVTGGTLYVTGNGSAVNGTTSTTAGYNASVNSLSFEPAANGATFTSTNLKTIGGALTLVGTSTKTGSSATVTMNPTTSTLTGSLAVGAGAATTASVTVAGTTTSVLGGSVTLTAGTLTLTRGGNSTVIGGGVTLTAGTLTLGSNVSVTGATSQVAGNLNAGGFTYTQLGGVNYVRTGAGTFTNGTLSLNSTAGNITLTPGATFSVPNLSSVGTANGVIVGASMSVTNLTLDNAATFTQGAGVLTVSGNTTVTNDAGAFTGALTLTGAAATATFGKDYTIPTLVINSTGTVTFATDDMTTPTPRTVTVSGAFTNTAGTLALGINNLTIANPGTFTYTAGAITQGTGVLTWNTGGAVTLPATGFAIDNLTVSTAVTVGTSAFTVNKNLVISGTITTSADGKLTLGNGCNVTRTDNAATLAKLPTFGTSTNVTYSTYTGAADITSGKELPATVNNLTIVAGANHAVLTASVTVTGTLSLAALLDAITNTKVITMADGSTLELKADGTTVLDKDLTKAGAMNLVYNGAANTTTRELGTVTSGSYATYTGAVTVKSGTVALAANLTTTGVFTLDGGDFDLNGSALTLTNNVVTTSNGGNFLNGGAAANLNLGGATSSSFGLKATWAVPAAIKLTVNKAAASDSVSLTGGNLDFATNSATLYLAQGVLVTGNKIVILKQSSASGQPVQGFSKTGVSYVIGNVQKFIDYTKTVDISYVQFPVGTPDGNYRQLDYYFKTAPQSSINLTVSAANVSAGGSNGFPITAGSLTLTNYTPFFWYVKSDIPLAPSYKYDMDAQAQGYTDYVTDQIQNVRFVRRDSGNVNNQWILQGGSTYDNSTIAANWPVVKVIDAQGGFSTQGSIFAYSQLNKAPKFTSALANLTPMGGDTVNVTVTAVDPDLNQTATLSLPVSPAWLTLANGKLTGTVPNVATTYNVTVRATDNLGAYTDSSFTITVTFVNHKPVFTAQLADTTVKNGVALTFKYTATDADAGQTLKYMLVPVTGFTGTASIDTVGGTLTLTPAFADAGKSFSVTVKVTDGIDTVTSNTAKVTVNYATKRGDVNGDGKIDGTDAVQILNWVVGIVPPAIPTTGTELFYAADVDGNGAITVNDAYFALFAATHDTLPNGQMPKMAPASGDLSFSGMARGENGVINVPLRLANTNNVLSAYIELNIDSKLANIQEVASNLPQGWMMAHNYVNGKLIIAMTGTKPLNDGNFATISLKLNSSDTKLDISGSAKFNDDLGATLSNLTVKEIPSQFGLSQNYPNPFNPTTTIKYQIAQDTKVVLDVYDMLGQKVRTLVNDVQSAGYYNVTWDGQNSFGQQVSSGVYIYRLQAGNFVQTMKMNLLK